MDIFINFLLPLIVGIISSIIATQITVRHVNPEYLIKRKIKMALKMPLKLINVERKILDLAYVIFYIVVKIGVCIRRH